jgi:hypothetical protein
MPAEKEPRKFETYKYEKQSIENFIMSKHKELTPHTLANMLMSREILRENLKDAYITAILDIPS